MNHTPSYSVTLNHDVLHLLQEPEPTPEGRFDKMAAFSWLTDQAALSTQPHEVNFRGSTLLLTKGQLATSFSELSETWGWHRNNVRYFLLELERLHALTIYRCGKATVLTLPLLFEGDTSAVSLLSPEDTNRLYFALGMTAWEELFMLFDDAMSSVEDFLNSSQPVASQDKPADTVMGRRLHRVLNHLVLCSTDLFPRQSNVTEALRRLFVEEAGCDLTAFLSLLSFGGINVLHDIGGQSPSPLTLSDDVRQLLRTVIDYYTPLLRRESFLFDPSAEPHDDHTAAG